MEELLLTPWYLCRDYHDILCVGESFSDPEGYCARSVAPPGAIRNATISGVRNLLANISAAPRSTTFEDLYKLAELCLCQSHVSQAHMVASEWEKALRTMRQPSRGSVVTNTHVRRLEQTIQSLENDLANVQAGAKDQVASLREQNLSWKKEYESLSKETKVAQQTSAKDISDLEAKVSCLTNSFHRGQREISAQRQSLSDLREARTKIEADAQQSATQLRTLRAEHTCVKDEVQLLQARLQQSVTQNQALETERAKANDEIKSLREDISNLRIKVVDLERSNASLVTMLATKDLALQREESRVKEFLKVISALEISEAHLKQVIASCWLHRIYNWFTGSRLVL
ncbi:uncharacterized protein B0J16DRAFT_181806 [Fusarium flagelliforme]|uniref:uncharacterized protein n=1 Tax=Fusarium flagelliforme TaxID=2675880 RepID=UPI001E8E7E0A|nr:uncharacterized protein B0J16DRAFT_181806 [Fusarium flagelliforme]KAH7174392.1 hypothetical protein B0J16DRAFT_181806 [Fusarium flagelliforme]